jgi:hypothetical protein
MTISMHGNVLALASVTPVASIGDLGYQLTVNVPSYASGTSTLGISITTENGYTDHANIATSGVTSWTFNIPPNQGWVRVCVDSDISSGETCKTYDSTGADMSVSLSPPSGDSNRYYVYPGNTYYIYPGIRHDYYFHHDWDRPYGGHEYGRDHWLDGHDHWLDGHQNSGNIGNSGNPNSGNVGNGGNSDTGNVGNGGNQDSGNNGFGGHQDNWLGGHQDGGNQDRGNNGFGGNKDRSNNGLGGHQDHWFGGQQYAGNRGATQPVDRLHQLSNGVPMMNGESSDDDE